jgi:hypothetical protein
MRAKTNNPVLRHRFRNLLDVLIGFIMLTWTQVLAAWMGQTGVLEGLAEQARHSTWAQPNGNDGPTIRVTHTCRHSAMAH